MGKSGERFTTMTRDQARRVARTLAHNALFPMVEDHSIFSGLQCNPNSLDKVRAELLILLAELKGG